MVFRIDAPLICKNFATYDFFLFSVTWLKCVGAVGYTSAAVDNYFDVFKF
jgi:hypothetical protein